MRQLEDDQWQRWFAILTLQLEILMLQLEILMLRLEILNWWRGCKYFGQEHQVTPPALCWWWWGRWSLCPELSWNLMPGSRLGSEEPTAVLELHALVTSIGIIIVGIIITLIASIMHVDLFVKKMSWPSCIGQLWLAEPDCLWDFPDAQNRKRDWERSSCDMISI